MKRAAILKMSKKQNQFLPSFGVLTAGFDHWKSGVSKMSEADSFHRVFLIRSLCPHEQKSAISIMNKTCFFNEKWIWASGFCHQGKEGRHRVPSMCLTRSVSPRMIWRAAATGSLFPCMHSAMQSVEPKQEKRRHMKHFRKFVPMHAQRNAVRRT